VLLHPEREGLDALECLPGVEGRLAGATGTDGALADGGGERALAEALREVETVGGVLPESSGKFASAWSQGNVPPSTTTPPSVVPAPWIHFVVDSPDDVGAVLDGAAEVGRRERVVHHERDGAFVGDGGEFLEVGRDERRVGDRLDVDERGVVVDGVGDGLGVERVDGADANAALARDVREVRRGAAVHLGARDDIAPALGERGGDGVDGAHSGVRGDGVDAAFEAGEAVLEDGDGGVGDAGVDVGLGVEGVASGRLVGAGEDVGGGLVDGGARAPVASGSWPAWTLRVRGPWLASVIATSNSSPVKYARQLRQRLPGGWPIPPRS